MSGRARPARPERVDLGALARGLDAADAAPFVVPAWLADASADPAGFWRAVAPALLAYPAGSSRSTPFERYSLAHELGARHVQGQTPAFVAFDAAAGFQSTSYARVVEGARALAGAWQAQGVVAGMGIAIVAPLAPELVTALLAAWHLGAVAAPVPVRGRTYLRDRLGALAPDFVATSLGRALWLELPAGTRLPTSASGGESAGLAYAYAPDEPALRVFSPLGEAPLQPFDVTAERLYLGALRDAALFFDLAAGQGVAAPGACEAQVGLPLLVTCLAAGAHLVTIGLDEACTRPERVCDGRVQVLGVARALRDAILGGGVGGVGPARWFRSPAGGHEPDAWRRLVEEAPFARARGGCYFPSPVAGGAITWSPWRRTPALDTALPAPGLAWQVLDPGRGGAVSVDGSGVLASEDAPAEAIGWPLLGQLAGGGEKLWVTSLGAHRDGQRLPAVELEALVAGREEVWAAALVDDPRAGAVLVVFARADRVGESAAARDALAAELRELVELELAPGLVPARVEVLTIAPHLGDDGAIDRDWCRGQALSGRLAAKQREPLFTIVARLRLELAELEG